MDLIKTVKAREVLDSRGNPTVEVEVTSEYDALDVPLFLVVHQQVFMKQ